MKEKIIARRYTEAFLSFARDYIGEERVLDELMTLKGIFYENKGLRYFLESLGILYEQKCKVIDASFKDFSRETRQFLKLLVEKERIKNIMDICDYAYSYGDTMDAVIRTSYPLEMETAEKIKGCLEDKLKNKLRLRTELDAKLIGGIQVTIGNKVLDGSVRRRLDDLKERLMAIKVD